MTATRLAGDQEGKGEGGKGNDDGNEGGRLEEGFGGKATRVAGELTAT